MVYYVLLNGGSCFDMLLLRMQSPCDWYLVSYHLMRIIVILIRVKMH
jgi:hypothetical protein